MRVNIIFSPHSLNVGFEFALLFQTLFFSFIMALFLFEVWLRYSKQYLTKWLAQIFLACLFTCLKKHFSNSFDFSFGCLSLFGDMVCWSVFNFNKRVLRFIFVLCAFRECFTDRCMETFAALAVLNAVQFSSRWCCFGPFCRRKLCKIGLFVRCFSPLRYVVINDFVALQKCNCRCNFLQ